MCRHLLVAVTLFLCLAGSAAAGDGPVRLAGVSPPAPGEDPTISLLTRELLRQAVLIAARDELGRPTRDQALHEPIDPEAGGLLVMPMEVRRADDIRHVRAELKMRSGEREQSLWQTHAPLGRLEHVRIDYLPLVEQAEIWSRTDFPEALRGAGIDGAANHLNPQEALPEWAVQRLEEMNYFSQFAALREIHAAIREQGESPALLGGLVRGYANLSRMAEMHWDASYKVCAARALLYAQRMHAVHGASADAFYHRAYARGMAGFHVSALEDLKQAERLRAEQQLEAPGWAPLLETYCRYDTGRLADLAVADPQLAPLGMYLCLLTVEFSGSTSTVIEFGKVALEMNPESLRIIDAMTEVAGVNYLHMLTELSPAVLVESMVQRLNQMPEAPQAVVREVRRWALRTPSPERLARAAAMLVESGADDTSEPSWSVLGRMIQESQFMHIERRANFMVFHWGVEADDYVDAVQPLIAEHRYRNLIESYAAAPPQRPELLREMEIVDAPYRMRRVWYYLQRQDMEQEPVAENLRRQTLRHIDDTVVDIESAMHERPRIETDTRRAWARRLLELSPHAPRGIAALIMVDWEDIQPQLAEWEQMRGDHPAVSAALARQYQRVGQLDDAERALKLYISRAPESWAYNRLARIYLEQGDEQRWLATLEEFLEHEDYGLTHARTRVNIAGHFMDKRDYERALPYAEAAAESWAHWAMGAAIECYEGLGDFENAELWVHRQAERYGEHFDWYLWCQRTGRGDIGAATRYAQTSLRLASESLLDHQVFRAGAVYLLEGDSATALRYMQQRMQRGVTPLSAMHIVLLSIELDDPEPGREALSLLFEKAEADQLQQQDETLMRLAELFHPVLETWPDQELDLAEVDRLLAEVAEEDRVDANALVGRYLVITGQPELAAKYLKRSLETPHRMHPRWDVSRAIAAVELRNMVLDAGPAAAQPDED